MSWLTEAIARQCTQKRITYQYAVERFELTDAEQKELIVLLKSMEYPHGQTTEK